MNGPLRGLIILAILALPVFGVFANCTDFAAFRYDTQTSGNLSLGKRCLNPENQTYVQPGATVSFFTSATGSAAECEASRVTSTCDGATNQFTPRIPATRYASCGSSGGASAGCGRAGQQTGEFQINTTDGNNAARLVHVVVPATYNPSVPLALTFGFHAVGGNPLTAMTYGIQNAPGAGQASIFVFPQGLVRGSSTGWDNSCQGPDMVLFDRIVAAIEANYCIDRGRVFVAGFSGGCSFATALACCRGNRIRGASVAACTSAYNNLADYRTYDNFVNGMCPSDTRAAVRFAHDASGGDAVYPAPSFATTNQLFQAMNACSNSSTPISGTSCSAYAGCRSRYVQCAHPGINHTLPSGWGTDTWNFFNSL